jgi:hypothetical protein
VITRLEAIRYRCFERLGIDLVIFGLSLAPMVPARPRLLDLPVLFGDLLRATTLLSPSWHVGRTFCLARTGSLRELIFCPARQRLLAGSRSCSSGRRFKPTMSRNGAHSKTEKPESAPSVQRTEALAHTHALRNLSSCADGMNANCTFVSEYPIPVSPRAGPGSRGCRASWCRPRHNRHWRLILKRDRFRCRIHAGSRLRQGGVARLVSPTVLGHASRDVRIEHGIPGRRWLYELLTGGAVFLDPNWAEMRQASPPGQPRTVIPSGRNIPWLALTSSARAPAICASRLPQRGLCGLDCARPNRLAAGVDIDVREREDDHHAYFV